MGVVVGIGPYGRGQSVDFGEAAMERKVVVRSSIWRLGSLHQAGSIRENIGNCCYYCDLCCTCMTVSICHFIVMIFLLLFHDFLIIVVICVAPGVSIYHLIVVTEVAKGGCCIQQSTMSYKPQHSIDNSGS